MAGFLWSFLLPVLAGFFLREALHNGYHNLLKSGSCYDAYTWPPALTVYNADQLHKDDMPKPGMAHITLAGTKHMGLRHFEVWVQSIAAGQETPIHSHPPPCEEINYVTRGSGVARALAPDGRVLEHKLSVANTQRKGDLQVLVVIGCRQPGITVYPAWNSSQPETTALAVMPWNKQCPPGLGAALQRLA